jgi:hypothetical protein
LSVLALIGIAVSLLYQAREHKANREQALRSSHMDLMQKAMEDPLCRPGARGVPAAAPQTVTALRGMNVHTAVVWQRIGLAGADGLTVLGNRMSLDGQGCKD